MKIYIILLLFLSINSFSQKTKDSIIVYRDLELAVKKSDKVRILNLTSQRLVRFPDKILQLKELEVLILNFNAITTIPCKISKLTKLRRIYLYANPVKTLPETIGELNQLEYLVLTATDMQESEVNILRKKMPNCIFVFED